MTHKRAERPADRLPARLRGQGPRKTRLKEIFNGGVPALVTVAHHALCRSHEVSRWRRADRRGTGPPRAGAAGRGGADRGRRQRPGGGQAVPGVADVGEPVAAALAAGGRQAPLGMKACRMRGWITGPSSPAQITVKPDGGRCRAPRCGSFQGGLWIGAGRLAAGPPPAHLLGQQDPPELAASHGDAGRPGPPGRGGPGSTAPGRAHRRRTALRPRRGPAARAAASGPAR
jgi:hypothetical protein